MEKLVRTDAYKLDADKYQATLEGSVVTATDEINAVNDVDELKKLEKDLMEDFKEYEDHIKEVKYSLPAEITYDGTKMTSKQIKVAIIQFLNKLEVDFRSTLGIYQAIRYWKESTNNDIEYIPYETTLRLLGTLKYRGEKEFSEILIVNNWFASAHEEYKKDAMWQGYLSTVHNEILKRMDALSIPAETAPVDKQEAVNGVMS